MLIRKFVLGQLRVNCYLLVKGNNCLIIDPGDEANFILENTQRMKLKPIAILVTHGHFDHVMAVGEIQLSFNVPLYIFQEDLFLIKRLNKTAEHFLDYNPAIIEPKNIKYLKTGLIKIGEFDFEIISTPGHTPGGCCFYFKKEKVVFTGDTLFKEGIGRYDFSYSSKEDLKQSLKKLFKLPEETIVYSGHGEETSVGGEKNIL